MTKSYRISVTDGVATGYFDTDKNGNSVLVESFDNGYFYKASNGDIVFVKDDVVDFKIGDSVAMHQNDIFKK